MELTKLEKTIKGLECCILRDPDDHARCGECPYKSNCVNRLKIDALDLLKKQEPKFVSDIAEAIIGCKPKVKVGHCPSCGVLMSETDRYCRKCGQAVKWE